MELAPAVIASYFKHIRPPLARTLSHFAFKTDEIGHHQWAFVRAKKCLEPDCVPGAKVGEMHCLAAVYHCRWIVLPSSDDHSEENL
jgi:hypothetical protein